MRLRIRISAMIFGVVVSILAVAAQIFLSFQPPQAYGVCMVCHARDMVLGLINALDLWAASVSSAALKGPVLTTAGVVLGAGTAAFFAREFRPRFTKGWPYSIMGGLAVITAGLVISGCPMRLLLRAAYGDITAAVSVAALILGILAGTLLLKKRRRVKSVAKAEEISS